MASRSLLKQAIRSLATKANTSSQNFAKVIKPKVSLDNLDVLLEDILVQILKKLNICYLL